MATPKKATKAPAKAGAAKKAKKVPRASRAPKVQEGRIAHTELASADPAATRAWAERTLGWSFMPPMPTPGGDYHMWTMGRANGGGIRATSAPEAPGTLIYIEVADVKRAYAKAIKNGAKSLTPPEAIGGGMGSMAVVSAPGEVAVGFWAAK